MDVDYPPDYKCEFHNDLSKQKLGYVCSVAETNKARYPESRLRNRLKKI